MKIYISRWLHYPYLIFPKSYPFISSIILPILILLFHSLLLLHSYSLLLLIFHYDYSQFHVHHFPWIQFTLVHSHLSHSHPHSINSSIHSCIITTHYSWFIPSIDLFLPLIYSYPMIYSYPIHPSISLFYVRSIDFPLPFPSLFHVRFSSSCITQSIPHPSSSSSFSASLLASHILLLLLSTCSSYLLHSLFSLLHF